MILSMHDLLTKDLHWKLASLGLALGIWFTVRHEIAAPEQRTFESVPVLIVSGEADVREFKVNPDAVRVIVSGRPDTIRALDQKDIHAVVDLTGGSGLLDQPRRVDVSVPPGIMVVRLSPSVARVVVPPKWER